MTGSDWQLGGAPLYDERLVSRSITHENRKGEKGRGGMAAGGRKGSACLGPFVNGSRFDMADIEGPGCIRHIWITTFPGEPLHDRNIILRVFWDGQTHASVEAPLSDFFGLAHGRRTHFLAAYTGMPEGRAFNCLWPMPFAKHCRIEVENDIGEDCPMFFYQVDYTLGDDVTPDTPYFHAQFRRTTRTTMLQDYTILDGVEGRGRFLGSNVGIIPSAPSPPFWWGEGEVKVYLDGDTDFPTICGTGSEDYVCSGWGLGEFTGPYFGAPLLKHGLVAYYRYHILDPIYFSSDIRVTVQQMGSVSEHEARRRKEFVEAWRSAGKTTLEIPEEGPFRGGFDREDDYCSTAYWYQTLPTKPFPPPPDRATRSHDIGLREEELVQLDNIAGWHRMLHHVIMRK